MSEVPSSLNMFTLAHTIARRDTFQWLNLALIGCCETSKRSNTGAYNI